MNELTSRYSLIAHVPFKTAQAVSDTMISLLRPFSCCVHILNTDDGKEFAQHERIASALDADFFIMHRLNHRPRKCLGFKTHHEIFVKQLQSHRQAVALRA